MSPRYAFAVLFTMLTLIGCGSSETSIDTDDTTVIDETIPASDAAAMNETETPDLPETSRDSAFVIADESVDVVDEGSADDQAQSGDILLGNPAPGADSEATTDEISLEKADVGVGKKGRGYGGGPISEPAKQYFDIRERTVFQIQIPQALKMYEALNGKKPASHEEFMSKVLKENDITLPELPEGRTYLFDPEQGELMIQSGK